MKRQMSLKTRIALIIALILSIGSLLTMFVIRQLSKVRFESEKYEEIVERQSRFDSALLDIFNRVTLSYLDLFDDSSQLTDYFSDDNNPKLEKEVFFQNLITSSQIDPDTFGEIIIYYENDFYRGLFQNRVVSYPDIAYLNLVMSSSNDTLDYSGIYTDDLNDNYMVFSRKIITMYPERESFAVVLFYVKVEVIYDILQTVTSPYELSDGFSFLVSDSSRMNYSLLHSVDMNILNSLDYHYETYTQTKLYDKQVILIASELSSVNSAYRNLDIDIITVLSSDRIFNDINLINRLILIVGGISIIIIAFLSRQVASKLTKPLDLLVQNLRHFSGFKQKSENFGTHINDEISELEQTYDEMIDQIVELIETNSLEMENKRKLELYALQMQINPHFLYNTLDTIAWMAKLKKEPDIEKLVIALAKFFRISLHKGDKYITVEEEFDLVKNFVEVQMIRFPHAFEVIYELNPEIRLMSTLKLILQPIVENAIKHGFVGLDRIGHIRISAKPEGDTDILFEVEDDGVGFLPTDDLFSEKRLLDGLGGYGLKNVDERIKLEYGRNYGITVTSVPNQGTKVIVRTKRIE